MEGKRRIGHILQWLGDLTILRRLPIITESFNDYLLEGMGCPGGCAAGAGTLLPVSLAATVVGRYQSEAKRESLLDSEYKDQGKRLEED